VKGSVAPSVLRIVLLDIKLGAASQQTQLPLTFKTNGSCVRSAQAQAEPFDLADAVGWWPVDTTGPLGDHINRPTKKTVDEAGQLRDRRSAVVSVVLRARRLRQVVCRETRTRAGRR